MKHTTTIRVRFYELDPYGHVNHSVYIQYFEAARALWLNELGFPLDRLQRDGIQIVVTEINTRYLGSAGPDEELVVETKAEELRRVSMRFFQRILRGDDILVEQTISAACINDSGRPVRVPADLATALKQGQ